MTQNLSTNQSLNIGKDRSKLFFILPLLFFIVLIAGLFYVKWNPYYGKAFIAASKHSIGPSIVTGDKASAPAPSWSAAVKYMASYFKSVWKAVILGLLLGSLIQVLIPKDWIKRVFGRNSFGATVVAGTAALPSMMCTCCAAPVAVGLRKKSASINATMAFFLANPVLNPATIIFMGFVLSWKFAIYRIVVGMILVLLISTFAGRLAKGYVANDFDSAELVSKDENENILVRWLKALGQLIIDTIPAYIVVVAILGATRAWLFPSLNPAWSGGLLAILILAISGTLFVIPTAAEIPIVQSLMTFGLGVGPAATLLITLPAVSLPSLLIVKRAFPGKVLVMTGVMVALIGIVSGLFAIVLL